MDISRIIKAVERERSSPLDDNQKLLLVQYVKQLDSKIFTQYKLSDVYSILGKILNDQLVLDYKDVCLEMMKKEEKDVAIKMITSDVHPDTSTEEVKDVDSTEIIEFLGINELSKLVEELNPAIHYKKQYIVLDTDYRDTVLENPSSVTKFKWSYSATPAIISVGCSSVEQIENIIAVKMYQPILPNVGRYDNVFAVIDELSAQSFIDRGIRYHFKFKPRWAALLAYSELEFNDLEGSYYKFNRPIKQFDTLTLIFYQYNLTPFVFSTPIRPFSIMLEFTCLQS